MASTFTAACFVETFLVSLQAWRGVPSHFNVETPFDAAVAQALAIGGVMLVAVVLALVSVFNALWSSKPWPGRPVWQHPTEVRPSSVNRAR